MSRKRTAAYLYLITATIIWGLAGPVAKFTLGGFSPSLFLAYRFTISAVIGIIFFLTARPKIKHKKKTLALVGANGAVLYTISLTALFVGLSQSTVLDLSLIASFSPLLLVAGGAMLFHDHITHMEKLGISIALVGVLLSAIIPTILASGFALTGNVLILLFVAVDAISVLFSKSFLRHKVEPSVAAQGGLVGAGVVFLVAALARYGVEGFVVAITEVPFKFHLGILYMAFLSGSLAYYLYYRGARSIEISETALFTYLQPIFAVPLAVLWLGEKITPLFIFGAVIITLGVAIAEWKRKRKA